MEIEKYFQNKEMKNYSLYLDKGIVEDIKKKIKVPLSRIINDFLIKFAQEVNDEN